MSRLNELLQKFRLKLQCRKYATSSIDTYTSCLTVFLKAMNGKPKPLPMADNLLASSTYTQLLKAS